MGNNLYSKIEEDIKRDISNGRLKPGEKLPTEIELIEQYKVSKITMRRALQNLIDKGYLLSKERIGFYVTEPNKTKFAMKFDPQVLCCAFTTNSQIVSCNTMVITDSGKNAVEITKLISEGSIAVCAENYLLYGKAIRQEFTLRKFDEAVINDKIEVLLNYAENKTLEIRVCIPPTNIRLVLDIDEDEPVMLAKTDYYDEYNRCYAHRFQYYIKESFLLRADLIKGYYG